MSFPTPPATAIAGSVLTASFWNTQVRDALIYLEDAVDGIDDVTRAFGGSDQISLAPAASAVSGSALDARAPGSGFFTVADDIDVFFSATLWAESGGTASVALYATDAANTAVSGSTITSTHASGELKETASAVSLVGGKTYFIKGCSGSTSKQAWGVGYAIRPSL